MQKRWASQPAPGIRRLVAFLPNWFFFFFHESRMLYSFITAITFLIYIYTQQEKDLTENTLQYFCRSVEMHRSLLLDTYMEAPLVYLLHQLWRKQKGSLRSSGIESARPFHLSLIFVRAWGGFTIINGSSSMGIMLLVPNQHCLNYAHRWDALDRRLIVIDGHRTYCRKIYSTISFSASNVHINMQVCVHHCIALHACLLLLVASLATGFAWKHVCFFLLDLPHGEIN